MIRFLNFAQEKPMTEQRDSQSVTPGDEIAARYKFIEKLGEGGMGSVFKAHDKILGRSVAVKVLNVSTTSQDDVVRFHREAKAASHIVHPNVIKVLDFGITENGQPYMVMEFVNGINLRASEVRRPASHATFSRTGRADMRWHDCCAPGRNRSQRSQSRQHTGGRPQRRCTGGEDSRLWDRKVIYQLSRIHSHASRPHPGKPSLHEPRTGDRFQEIAEQAA